MIIKPKILKGVKNIIQSTTITMITEQAMTLETIKNKNIF